MHAAADPCRFDSFLFVGLIGFVLASMVNLFLPLLHLFGTRRN